MSAARQDREPAPAPGKPHKPHKSPRPNPASLYPAPPGEGREHLGHGLRHSHLEVRAMDTAALEWDLRRVSRALAAFTEAERRAAYGSKQFSGSRRNPVVLFTGAYPFLLSDYLADRECFIRRELRRRAEESTS